MPTTSLGTRSLGKVCKDVIKERISRSMSVWAPNPKTSDTGQKMVREGNRERKATGESPAWWFECTTPSIVWGFEYLVPSWCLSLGWFRRYDLTGGSMSLGQVGFEVLKVTYHFQFSLFPACGLRCALSASRSRCHANYLGASQLWWWWTHPLRLQALINPFIISCLRHYFVTAVEK